MDNQDIPRQMPSVLTPFFGSGSATPAPELTHEEIADDWNPWTAGSGSKGIPYISPETEDEFPAASISALQSLARPAIERTPIKLGDLRPVPVNDDPSERVYEKSIAPIKRLFHPSIEDVARAEASYQLQKSASEKRVLAPWHDEMTKAEFDALTFKRRVVGDTTWEEGFDTAGEIKSARMIDEE